MPYLVCHLFSYARTYAVLTTTHSTSCMWTNLIVHNGRHVLNTYQLQFAPHNRYYPFSWLSNHLTEATTKYKWYY